MWNNTKLIFFRELRDQLRDRRMLFLYAVLPLLMYPAMGMLLFQLGQFVHTTPTTVFILGTEHLPESPKLFHEDRFMENLFEDEKDAGLLISKVATKEMKVGNPPTKVPLDCDGVLVIPPNFGEQVEQHYQAVLQKTAKENLPTIQTPVFYYDTSKEKSNTTKHRIRVVLEQWAQELAHQQLIDQGIPKAAMLPAFVPAKKDLAVKSHEQAAIWAKIFPFIVVVWALTGAFHPAVDLCAGEKERGTLETLLCSPASRSSIVFGKLLTIICFSMMTVFLNVFSMGLTGFFILQHIPGFGPPPAPALLWVMIAAIPLSALFGSMCLAIAAFAKSTAEGHYYMMPLFMIMLPLMMLPLMPEIKMSLGYSLIPVAGMVLLLRLCVEGDYAQVLPFVLPVFAVTIGAALIVLQWTVELFNRETVLFREAEKVDPKLLFKALFDSKSETPTATLAIFAAFTILMLNFLISNVVSPSLPLMVQLLIPQTVLLVVTFSCTFLFTSSPTKTLSLSLPKWQAFVIAPLLAILFQPLVQWIGLAIQSVYQIPPEVLKQLEGFQLQLMQLPFWQVLLLIAVMPAICEELAFRGLILSGLKQDGKTIRAVILSSIFFGVTHMLLQQSLNAMVIGLILGYLTVTSRSIFPAMIYHAMHNGYLVLSTQINTEFVKQNSWMEWLVYSSADQPDVYLFRLPMVLTCTLLAASCIGIWERLRDK